MGRGIFVSLKYLALFLSPMLDRRTIAGDRRIVERPERMRRIRRIILIRKLAFRERPVSARPPSRCQRVA
jgi:hypothetical protein